MIEMYYHNTEAKEQRKAQIVDMDRMLDDLLLRIKTKPTEEEGEEAITQQIEKMMSDLKSKQKEMFRDSFMEHGRNTYKTIEDAFKAMGWPSDIEVKDLGNGFYQIENLTVQFFMVSKPDPLRLEKKEVTVKWVLK